MLTKTVKTKKRLSYQTYSSMIILHYILRLFEERSAGNVARCAASEVGGIGSGIDFQC